MAGAHLDELGAAGANALRMRPRKHDLDRAAERFAVLIDLWGPVVVEEDMAIAQTTFAMLVGRDHPAAAQAAREAYRWLAETGTTCFMDVWADGLPDQTDLEGAAVG